MHLCALNDETYFKNNFNNGDKIEIDDGCNYFGNLAIEKDACVAMTGCFGSDDIELTIMSSHVIGSTGFVWTKEGIVHAVDVDKKVWYFVTRIVLTYCGKKNVLKYGS